VDGYCIPLHYDEGGAANKRHDAWKNHGGF
jgi:hypothetical protein